MRNITLLAFGLILSGCAETTIYSGGQRIFRTQANAVNVSYVGNGVSFHADSLNHSTPTLALGKAISHVVTSAGAAAVGIGAAFGTGDVAPIAVKSAASLIPTTVNASQTPLR